MRLIRLDLEKYGAFDGRTLAFRPGARLHVVFGPNEAGKSSALAAVSDLLFGFGHRTDFDFRHGAKDLRLGAEVETSDGRRIVFRRRKGAKATLVGLDDAPLRDDLLAPALGALTRDVFERAFGLTARMLREGGEDLRRSDGEAGASLFAAASGLRGLEDQRRAIESEADALFRPQASTRRFNEEFRRFEAARKELAANELGATAWKRLNETIEELATRHAELDARLKSLRTDRARIERLARANRAAASVDAARRALEEEGEPPELFPGAAEALKRGLDAADFAAEAEARAAGARKEAETDVASVALDASALAAADAIESVFRDSGGYRTLQTDMPRVQREADEREAALSGLAARLGLADADAVEAARPTDAARAELKTLIDEGRDLVRAAAARAEAMTAERERSRALEAARGTAEALDPRPLREAFAALAPRLSALDRRDELVAEAQAEVRALAAAAARLSPGVDDLERLFARELPGLETIARVRNEAERHGAETARAQEGLDRDRGEARRVEEELRALASGGAIASPQAIGAARAWRQAAWEPLRDHLLGGVALDRPAASRAAAALEHATAEADRLADRAAEDAGRVAREAELKRRGRECAEKVAEGETRLVDLAASHTAAAEAWADIWRPCGLGPLSPAEMEAWRRDLAALLDRRERNGRRLADIAALDAAETSLAPELAALAAAAGLDDLAALGARSLGARLGQRLAGLADRWQAAAEAAAAIAEIGRRLTNLEAQERAAAAGAADTRARLARILPAAGLAPDASFAAAAAALAAWDEAPGLIDERDYRIKRIRGMRRDAEMFSARVAQVVATVAPDLADLSPDAAARRLNERLTAARAAEARRVDAARRLEAAQQAEAAAATRLAQARQTVAEASAGLPEGADLRALLAQAEACERLKATLAERRSQLALVGERADEDALRAELEGFDPDAAPAAIEGLKAEEGRVEAEDRQLYAELVAEREKLAALGGAGAERAAAEQRAASAALAATAREWAVLKVAALLLAAAVERARATDRSPTLERAADLFRTLTGGAFSGFVEDYEKDEPTLVAARDTGERVAIGGLSEGTRDQFYLALRLAALEDYAARAEAAPFIGDDLFASFDETRAANGLKALAEVGACVQPILFTHHRSIVAAAYETLGEAADVIEIPPFAR